MDATSMEKLKELVTSRRLKQAETLLSEYLLESPDDYALLMHMGGIQSSQFKWDVAERYYKKAILIGKRQSGSAKVQLMRIYSQQSRHRDLIILLLKCLETESKSITLKQQIIKVFMSIFEYKSALIYSRQLIEQIKEIKKNKKQNKPKSIITDEYKKTNERIKVLSDPFKQSDLYFIHCQILNKVGRFSDSIIYNKKAIQILDEWMNSLSMQQRNIIYSTTTNNINRSRPMMMGANLNLSKQSMEYNQRMNRFYGYLGLCYLHIDDVENALKSFKKAKNINNHDRIAQNNIYNITNNRALFDKCIQLKGLYERWIGNKLTENDKKFDLKDKFLEYIQLLIQQKRLFLARKICEKLLEKGKFDGIECILGYHTPKFIIMYEDILRLNMNEMIEYLTEDIIKKMDKERNKNGPQFVLREIVNKQEMKENKDNDDDDNDNEDEEEYNINDNNINIKDLTEKIWEIRCKIDMIYSESIKLSQNDINIHIAYGLALWRIGYNSEGIALKTDEWIKYNTNLLTETKYYLARGNAFINDDCNISAMIELQNALKICSGNDEDKSDEIQTRLLMAVTYNKMNKLDEAYNECQYILNKLDLNGSHQGTLKMYAAILQRMKKYKKSKEIYCNLLKKDEYNISILREYINLLVEMREYDEAKKRLQFILSLKPENMLNLMYEFGLICYKMKDFKAASKTFISIISQQTNINKFDGAYINLINIYREEIDDLNNKLNEIDDDDKNAKFERISFEKEAKIKHLECEKYIFLWIDNDCYNKMPYFMYMEYLWSINKFNKIKKIWNEWIKKFENEYNEQIEGTEEKKDNEDIINDKKEKAAFLLSELYQKYARILTQNKVISLRRSHDNDDNDNNDDNDDKKSNISICDDIETSNEEIEGYFSKSLELNGKCIDGLQGFAAYYISLKQYIHALPFLQRAKSLNKSNSSTWIQLSRLCQSLSTIIDIDKKIEKIPNHIDLLKEGLKYIENFKYKQYKNYINNMIKISQELIEKLILFGGDDINNINLAQNLCWNILNKFDKLNITALRDISKVCDDRNKIDTFFNNLLIEFPSYCPALVEYAQFLTTSKDDRLNMLNKAEMLLEKAINITSSHNDDDDDQYNTVNIRYRCVALYMLGFVKLHKISLNNKEMNNLQINTKLNNEARQLFIDAVKSDENNIYARINLAQFLAFKDNENDKALNHLEFAYNNLEQNDPNLIANLIKVLAKKAIENEENINIDLLRRACNLCGNALRKFNGHFGLIVARSSLQNIKKKFSLFQLDDGLNDDEINNTKTNKLLQPQTTYGMIGVDIMNTEHLKKINNNNNNDNDNND